MKNINSIHSKIGPHTFTCSNIVTPSGHSRNYEETYQWIKPLLRKVPITRVVDVTPIDYLGLPVWSAITPLARDLTVHAGKGRTPLAAKLSAIMEAIERCSAEEITSEKIITASYQDLIQQKFGGIEPLNPESLDLPFESAYTPQKTYSWVVAFDLVSERHYWVPLDSVVSPSREGLFTGVETNGLASGNTYTEATTHAICELVERDALAREQFYEMYAESTDWRVPEPKMIRLETLPAECQPWIEKIKSHGLELAVQDMTTEIGVPVYTAHLIDRNFPANPGVPLAFGGAGCDLSHERASFRAITEAIQAHAIVMLGSRDEFDGARSIPDRSAMYFRRLGI